MGNLFAFGKILSPWVADLFTAFGMPSALTLAFCVAWSICFSLPLECRCRYRHVCSIRSLSLYHLPVVGEFSFPTFDAETTVFGVISSAVMTTGVC